jgi:hypothetical protein
MRTLGADDVIRLWEAGHGLDAVERALTLLAGACGGGDDPRRLSLGRRNAHLIDLRRRLFGAELSAFSVCPGCGEALEFSVPADAIAADEPLAAAGAVFAFESDGYAIRFRLLDSTDLAAAAAASDADEARRVLAARCILEARRADEIVTSNLPEPILTQLAAHLAALDPQAETLIELSCPSCARAWQAPFDIASFCYSEISALAHRLLREVHALARAYAWREADILAMSAQRRRYYLEQLG